MSERIRLKRVRLFAPEWEGAVAGYTKNFLSANYWRVERLMEYEDAFSECYCVFLKLQREYFGLVDNPAWFMALYKTSLYRRFSTLSNSDSHHRSTTVYLEEQEVDSLPVQVDGGTLAEFISDLEKGPEEALALLRIILDAPIRFVRAVYECEKSEERLEMLLGVGVSFKALRELLEQFRQ